MSILPARATQWCIPIYRGAIVVNKNGNRYVNEAITFKMHSNACMAQPGKVTYQIFDQGVMDQSNDALPSFSFKSRVATGDILKAEHARRTRSA